MREIEQKFELADGAALPSFDAVAGVVTVTDPIEHRMEATYYDTADLRLTAAHLALRRRRGGEDEGWHLKQSVSADERLETHAPLGRARDGVPAALAGLVRSRSRGRRLAPIAKLESRRTVRRLVGEGGVVLAEIADDVVVGTALLGADRSTTTWREVEVELVHGDRDLLGAAAATLHDAGASTASWSSKLGRVLGGAAPEAPEPIELDARSRARDVVTAHLRDHVQRLVGLDPLVRRDEPDAVHQMRVATRRLRSALATFRRLVDDAVTEPARDELKWLGEVLGRARDAEVIHARLRDLLAEEPPALVAGPVARRIDTTMRARADTARHDVLATLDGDRYLRLLDVLDDVASGALVLDDRGDRKAAKVLPREVRRTRKRWQREVDALADAADADVQLHEVRKKAKRVRYAAEAVIPVFGGPAERLGLRMEEVQDVLGRHQDGIVTAAVLEGLAADARADGDDTFTYGRLHAIERRDAADAAVEGRALLDNLGGRSPAWLR